MSGIVGIVNLDGAPVDRDLLWKMTSFMAFRGPDAQEIWVDDNVGFGHTMLRTTSDAETEQQPLTLDGKVWLTADARIDGRAELLGELEVKLRRSLRIPERTRNDAELILFSYEAWGDECVNHLIGDFAFAVWDRSARRLFCARDHFGVKPFYYAQLGSTLVFSNTLTCVKLHPRVSDKLNEQAIGDFLVFARNQDLTTTTFSDIKRLAPAHSLDPNRSPGANRYWRLPLNVEVNHRRATDYIDGFSELLDKAVSDRMRTSRISVSLSGGLDSSSVAAAAVRASGTNHQPCDIQAFTMVYETLINDSEGHHAGVVAKHLGIPINYLNLDAYELYEGWDQPESFSPEPIYFPFSRIISDHSRLALTHSRVLLTGDGGDLVLLRSWEYLGELIRSLKWWTIASFFIHYSVAYRRLPMLGFRTILKKSLAGDKPQQNPIPDWISPDFATRAELRTAKPPFISLEKHPVRSEAYEGLAGAAWSEAFEQQDPGFTGIPIERRNPFFDRRMVEFLLNVPPIPWFIEKEILRRAMQGILPDSICVRAKSPMSESALGVLWSKQWRAHFDPQPELTNYVDVERFLNSSPGENIDARWHNLLPVGLNYWLRNANRARHNAKPLEIS
jgi:asparagine synthase (glutamine-hydrolysing)